MMNSTRAGRTHTRRSLLKGLAGLVPAAMAAQSSTAARIAVNPSAAGNSVSPLLFGCGIEWAENGNRIFDPNARRNRPEVVAALKKLRLTTLRFPGGIMADYYNWRDGVGMYADRPKRPNPMDGTLYENNFGTDEFLDLCRQIGAQPVITLNAGTGTLEMALNWQTYLRASGMRVRYFEVGNEIYLAEPRMPATIAGNDSRIYKTAEEYTALYKEWAPALRAADSECLVGAIAGTYNTSKENQGWLEKLLAGAGNKIDFIALHNAFAPIAPSNYNWTSDSRRADAYRAMYTANTYSAEDTRIVMKELLAANPSSEGRIAVTEHFPLFGAGGTHSQLVRILDQSRTVAAGIYTASVLHYMMRRGAWMAHFNLATSPWFGALLQDTASGLIENPHYFAFLLLRELAGGALVQTDVAGPTFDSRAVGVVAAGKNTPALDAVAVTNEHGLWLSVVNRDLSRTISTTVDIPLAGFEQQAQVSTLQGPVPHAIRGTPLSDSVVQHTDGIGITESAWNGGSGASYSFPPLSVTRMFWGRTAQPKPQRQLSRKSR